jgi:starvation-inducible DNA-binding protein
MSTETRSHSNGNRTEATTEPAWLVHETRNPVPRETRLVMVKMLNGVLCHAIDLEMHARMAHWNLRGAGFIGLHELFEEVYGGLGELTDAVAERATQLGGRADGTAATVTERSTVPTYPQGVQEPREHAAALADSIASVVTEARRGIATSGEWNDEITEDLLTEMSRKLEKWLWMVESHGR